jgi:hypothetical protein
VKRTFIRALTVALGSFIVLGVLASPVAEAAPPGMPDPSQMSGIPRPDPNLAPGTITVRCLVGGFANPAVGIEVELEITTPSGLQMRKQMTVEQGRASFSGLEEFFDQSVVAKATIAGQPLQSQPFVIGRQAGVALLLVATDTGAGTAPGGDPHGGQGDVPMPGKPFPLAGRPPGTLVVGALDLGGGEAGGIGPIPDIEITLTATVPSAEGSAPIIETIRTDANGRALFENLDQRLPAGAQLIVSAQLEPGGEPEQSESFSLGTTAYAVILTRGEGTAVTPEQPPPPPQQPPPPQRVELPGPRVDKTLGHGQVRVFVVDANDQPVPDQLVMVHSSEATGDSDTLTGTTGPDGMVIIHDVPSGVDILSQVRVVYEGAPYSSVLFEMPEDAAGAVVIQRVFRPTGDRTRVRSALQIDVSPRENDYAAISFNYAVFIDGNEAFYVPGGMTLYGPVGTRSLHVMDDSKAYLMHDEEAPFFELDRPLEPGVELRLSFAVGMQHDGTLEIDWSTPFPLVENASLVTVPEELAVTHGVAGAPEVEPHSGRNGAPLELYQLGYQPFGFSVCDVLAMARQPCPIGTWSGHDIEIEIEGLPTRSRVWPYTAWGLLGATALGVAVSMLLRRRVSPREALLARRDALMAELVALDQKPGEPADHRKARVRLLRTLDRIYRQLEALGPSPARPKN